MNPEDRLITLRRGAAALEAVLAADEASSMGWPEDGDTLRFLRDVVGISDRLEMVIDVFVDDGPLGDLIVLSYRLETEDEVLERCERMLLESGPYRDGPAAAAMGHVEAIRALRELLRRYGMGEFHPDAFRELGAGEAPDIDQ